MPPEVLVDRLPALADALAVRVEREAAPLLAVGSTLALALAGGSVATAFFPRLARLPLDWARVAFFWADERAVPAAHADSNYRLARELWLDPAGVPAASVHRMPADAVDLEATAEGYACALTAVAGAPPRLGLALLGVGEDGHVASLFPGHPQLAEERRVVVPVLDAPKPPPRRLTLTLPVLADAGLVVVAAFGAAKRAPIATALAAVESTLPVALLLRRARRSLVLLDPGAAP